MIRVDPVFCCVMFMLAWLSFPTSLVELQHQHNLAHWHSIATGNTALGNDCKQTDYSVSLGWIGRKFFKACPT